MLRKSITFCSVAHFGFAETQYLTTEWTDLSYEFLRHVFMVSRIEDLYWIIVVLNFGMTQPPDFNLDVGHFQLPNNFFLIVAIRRFKKAETSSSNLNLRSRAWTRLNGRYSWRSVSVYPQILSPSSCVAWWTCLSILRAPLVLSLSGLVVRSGPRGYSALVLLGCSDVLLGRPRRDLTRWCEGQTGSGKDE